MAKRNELPTPFTPAACQRLRKLAAIRSNAITKKKGATELRDELQEEITTLSPERDAAKIQRKKADCLDAINEIEYWQTVKKSAENKMVDAIENGDQAELFEGVNINPTAKSLLNEDNVIGGGDADDEGDEAESREPVGAGAE